MARVNIWHKKSNIKSVLVSVVEVTSLTDCSFKVKINVTENYVSICVYYYGTCAWDDQ